MSGPPKTPTQLNLLRGKPGKRAVNKNEPMGTRGIPKCPSWLSAKAKQAWKEMGVLLDGMRVLNLEDKVAMELLCHTYSIWRMASNVINRRGPKGGLTYMARTEHGERSLARPEVAIERDSRLAFARMLRELALDVESPQEFARPPVMTGRRR